MPLIIEMDFTERFEWRLVHMGYEPLPGEILAESINGKVRRAALGPGVSTTAFAHDDVVANWQRDREEVSKARLAEGQPPLPPMSDSRLIAEHLRAGIMTENSPGVVTEFRLSPPDDELLAFLNSEFDVVKNKAAFEMSEDEED